VPTSPEGSSSPRAGRREPYLAATGITSGYNRVPVVHDVSVEVGLGEIVLIMGPNGAGKSTLVKAVTGKLPLMGGRVLIDGEDISQAKEDERAMRGIGYVPQSGDVFPTLSVHENLEMGGYRWPRREVRGHVERVLDQFPTLRPLRRRLARTLSGGERKALGIARALVADPQLLILDEPTSNLAPVIASRVLHEVVDGLAATGRAVLLIEQRVALGLEVASWGYVLAAGRTRFEASGDDLRSHEDLGSFFLEHGGATALPAAFRR
jgi:ABC-type branched-subunit amino acid transport system ATPase component